MTDLCSVTFQYASDLHLEFPRNRAYLRDHPLRARADVLLLAGDILPLVQLKEQEDELKGIVKAFEQVYWIPGNHEYYGSDVSLHEESFEEEILPGLRLVNNKAIDLGGVRLLFTTLWSRIDRRYDHVIQRGMPDFRLARYADERLEPAHVRQVHQRSMAFLERELTHADSTPTIVVSHHVPTFLHYPEQYKGSMLNSAFATELGTMISAWKMDAWIFGHHHHNAAPFTIGRTRMLTNQLGYVHMGEHHAFDPARTYEVNA